jgi:hypothetical protein
MHDTELKLTFVSTAELWMHKDGLTWILPLSLEIVSNPGSPTIRDTTVTPTLGSASASMTGFVAIFLLGTWPGGHMTPNWIQKKWHIPVLENTVVSTRRWNYGWGVKIPTLPFMIALDVLHPNGIRTRFYQLATSMSSLVQVRKWSLAMFQQMLLKKKPREMRTLHIM